MKIKCSMIVTVFMFSLLSAHANAHSVMHKDNHPNAMALSKALSAYHSFTADFTQMTTKQGRTLISYGYIKVQRPNQFIWATTKPQAQMFVSNGKLIYHYEADLQQVIVSPLTKELGRTPMMLLSGDVSQIASIFTIDKLTSQSYLLRPNTKNSLISAISIQFKEHKLYSISITNTMGQVTKLQFSKLVINPTLPKALFQFKAPKGVDVYHQ